MCQIQKAANCRPFDVVDARVIIRQLLIVFFSASFGATGSEKM